MPDLKLESELGAGRERIVIGLDEAGRGPLAGPVVAAAVWLDPGRLTRVLRRELTDSKLLSPERREALYDRLLDGAVAGRVAMASAWAEVAEIDTFNILRASLLAMSRAAAALPVAADAALVDGNQLPLLPCESRAVVGGDGLSLSIAAASIVAKVERDRMMERLAARHPGYGWERNRGYGTAEHRAALARLGATPEHRRSFAPVREVLALTL